ncbi:MAG: pyridoxamine 5'-phosphate oxidase [Prosthecobacter sp.]|uniref:pyridoxamine 5'-phosphate oxidase n=1 Tax=Prosthecobacter sp. TaxID=1965333 RepID=UPI0019FC584D|nr:pyridoxamine 5'-phosphate oxidase [Prosthecobacter sp.]MBE2285485.1 pyridoxamine 5'-phosphate oxidase [Prosthecobacter sp.]
MSSPDTPSSDLPDMRRHYTRAILTRESLLADPIVQFEAWLKDAVDEKVIEPNAMTLATASPDGRPLVRTVLLKALDQRGFVFFTNLESRKAAHITANPHVSMVFPWLALERQVIITGTASRISTAETLKYFLSRPRDSQIAAWASAQSRAISSRKVLEMEWAKIKAKFSAGEVPLPSFWGGFRVEPATIEFWQGGPHRLHDRFQYTRDGDGGWSVERLAP